VNNRLRAIASLREDCYESKDHREEEEMDRLESSRRGVYLTGARSAEVDVVCSWAHEHGLSCAWLSQADAVEREVDPQASLVVADARENPLDAIAQMARIRAAHRSIPLLLLCPPQQHEPSFLRAASRSGADLVLEVPLASDALRDALEQLAVRCTLFTRKQKQIRLSRSCVLDLDARCLRIGDTERRLTREKFELLAFLTRHVGHAVSAEQLVQAGILSRSQRSRFRAIVLELRNKLGDAREVIRTVPGYGYRLEPLSDVCSS
jgi:DNA-binding response OmpR family regulator